MNIIGYIRIGIVVALLLAVVGAFAYGKHSGKTEERLAAHEEALDRIAEMGENNADFLDLPAYDRCVAFMRDSELRVDICDQRFGVPEDDVHQP